MTIRNKHYKSYGPYWTILICIPKSSTWLSFLANSFLMNSLKLSKGPLSKSTLHKNSLPFKGFLISGDSLASNINNYSLQTDSLRNSIKLVFLWCLISWMIWIHWSDMQLKTGSWKASLCSVELLTLCYFSWLRIALIGTRLQKGFF